MTATTAVTPAFTNHVWVEIFNLIDDEKLRRKLVRSGDDAELERNGVSDRAMERITQNDWSTIYNAVWEKLHNSAAVGGTDTVAREWRAELRDILEQLPEYAYCQSCGAVAGKPHHDPDCSDVVTLHASGCWAHSHGQKMRLCMLCLAGAKQNWTATGERKATARKAVPGA